MWVVLGFFITFLGLSLLNTFFLPYLSFPLIHLLTFVSEFISVIGRHQMSCVSVLFAENICLFGSFLFHVAYKSPQAFSILQESLRAGIDPYSFALYTSEGPILASSQFITQHHTLYRTAYSSSLSWMVCRLRLCLQCTQTVLFFKNSKVFFLWISPEYKQNNVICMTVIAYFICWDLSSCIMNTLQMFFLV